MEYETIGLLNELENERYYLYQKYYNGKATKKDIKRIDEITMHISELNNT